ncbi:MAG: Dabb family protein [Candidatus Adiutrix sp.]|jgi:hypothetical protein|nr:Dabb family protein [Candidatus Adiutrix sp.]
MRHLLLLRGRSGGLTNEQKALIENAYRQLADAVIGVNWVRVRYNCVARAQNMDALVEIDLDGPETLTAYLEHPLHLELVRESQPFLSAVVSFDYQQ